MDFASFWNEPSQTAINIVELVTGKLLADARPISPEFHYGDDDICQFPYDFAPSQFGYQLSLGPDAFNIGFDNISFDVAAVEAPPIPLPASAWMLLAALGGIGAVARRRQRTAS